MSSSSRYTDPFGDEGYTEPSGIAEMLVHLRNPERRRELETYRVEFEKEWGQTDLTRRYTSTFPRPWREWLITHEPRRFYDGLPPFAKAYLRGKMKLAARDGSLDDMPDSFIQLFLRGEMTLDDPAKGR